MKKMHDYGGIKGLRGARDSKELERRAAIREAFEEAVRIKSTRLFWKSIRLSDVPEDGPEAAKYYEMFGEIPKRIS